MSLTAPSYVGEVIITSQASGCSSSAARTDSLVIPVHIPISSISGYMYTGFNSFKNNALLTEQCTFLATITVSPFFDAPHIAAIFPALLPFTRKSVSSAPNSFAALLKSSFIIPSALCRLSNPYGLLILKISVFLLCPGI